MKIKKNESDSFFHNRLQLLENNLDFSNLYFEKLNSKEKLCIVPIKSGFQSSYNLEKTKVTNLLLIINETDSIRKGNIVQYIPSDEQLSRFISKNTFFYIFNNIENVSDGNYSFLNLNEKVSFEITFKKGKPFSYGYPESREISQSTSKGNVTVCFAWYLVTTYFYDDGTSYTTEQYLYTSCVECQEFRSSNYGKLYKVNCGGGGGNGGGNGGTGEPPEPVTKPVNWVVGASSSGWWIVKSYETLYGEKLSGEPGGGYFTHIIHNASSIFNNVPNQPNYPYGTWHQLQATVWLNYDNLLASSSVSGKITFTSFPDINISKNSVWFFPIEFP